MNNPIGPLNQPLGSPPTNSLAAPDMVNEPPQDLKKARWYIEREIARRLTLEK